MDIKQVASNMQDIEFVLFTIKNGDIGKLHAGEVEKAHDKAKEIMEKYLQPLGAFNEDREETKTITNFDIWCEGYSITGNSAGATCLGQSEGKDFKEACINLSKKDISFAKCFDKERMTYWGCRLYDNGSDARKSFG